jgi:hypothetical protein
MTAHAIAQFGNLAVMAMRKPVGDAKFAASLGR